jgi:hypothetical protein
MQDNTKPNRMRSLKIQLIRSYFLKLLQTFKKRQLQKFHSSEFLICHALPYFFVIAGATANTAPSD